MTSRKFLGKTSREVLQKVKQALGPDALIVSSRPVEGGIEIIALPAGALERAAEAPAANAAPAYASDGIVQNLMREVSAMKDLLQREFTGMAWSGLKQRAPARAAMMQVLLGAGFSPLLARELIAALPEQAAESAAHKMIGVEIRNRLTLMDHEALVADGGVYALVGPTGVGKTTTVAKLAARCVVRHGASSLGLITTDSYRIAAHDQLRIYGKILNVPVHAIKDAGDLNTTLTKLRDKKTVLIDTIGMSQRDQLVAEQSAMLAACGGRVKRLLLLNAAANAATLDEVIGAYSGAKEMGGLHGCIVTKLDESASIAAALDCVMRHRLTLHYVTNGQRVPEDIHLPNADYLLHRALRPLKDANAHDLREDEYSLTLNTGAAYG
jgi:flagellar biosynthesis protein FlhF